MDVELNFDPAEVYDEVYTAIESLELSGGWEILSYKSPDIIKQRKDIDNTLIISSETIIKRQPEEIAQAILDTELRRQWDTSLSSLESLIQWGKNLQLIYQQQRYKWPLSDRDFVLIQGVSKELSDKVSICWKSVEYEKKPMLNGFVRGVIQYGGYIITKVDDENSHVSFIEKSPPNGSIPLFLWNGIQKTTAESLLSLKRFITS